MAPMNPPVPEGRETVDYARRYATSIPRRKRSGPEDDVTSAEDNDLPGKRARSMSTDSEGPLKDPRESALDIKKEGAGSADKRGTDDSGPVQQLVAMFWSFGCSRSDVSLVSMTMKGSDSGAKYPPSFLAGVLSLSTSYPQVVSRLHVNRSIPDNTTASQIEEERLDLPDLAFDDNSNHQIGEVGPEIPPPSVPLSSNDSISKTEEEILPIMSGIHEVDNLDGKIPGPENTRTSSLISAEFEDANREQFVSVSSRLSLELHPSTSTERSEELSPKGAATDASSIVSSAATSTGLPTIVVLPKLSAPVVNLDDVPTDQLQSLAFVRIIEAYKHTAVAGSSQVCFSLLAYLGVEFPSEIDPWKLLQNHILSDYFNLEVANKLFPLPTISQQIEDFAKEMLISVMQVDVADDTDADGSNTESQKDPVLEKQSNENQSVSAVSRDVSSDTHQSCTSKSISSLSTSEAQRCMSLYFALCTMKHSLFRHVFLVYKKHIKGRQAGCPSPYSHTGP